MELKEFLKPTMGKLLITIVIAFIPIYKRIICPFNPLCVSSWLNIFSVLNQFFNYNLLGTQGFIGKLQTYRDLIPDVLTYSIIYIISIFIIYLFSCFTVYIYKNLIKNSKK